MQARLMDPGQAVKEGYSAFYCDHVNVLIARFLSASEGYSNKWQGSQSDLAHALGFSQHAYKREFAHEHGGYFEKQSCYSSKMLGDIMDCLGYSRAPHLGRIMPPFHSANVAGGLWQCIDAARRARADPIRAGPS